MFYFGFQIVLLFLFFIVLSTFAKHKGVRWFLVFMGGFFIVIQLVSLAFNGALVDYRFYDQANLGDIWSIKGFFAWYIAGFALLFIAVLFLMNFLIVKAKKWQIKPIFSICILFLLGILLFLPKGAGANIYEIVHIKSAKVGSFPTALERLGIDPKKYTTHGEIEARPGKNIIVLSLESLERGYLEPPFLELTPNLRSLAKKYSYIKMDPQTASSWTSASMYTAITGVPAYFKANSNTVFQETKAIKIGNLGNVLQEAGYEMSYLLTKKDYSGMGDMLESFGFEVISDDDLDGNYEMSRWGVQDLDMFEILKKEILDKKNEGEPYAIFLSTISGHYPNGVYDKRMEAVLPKRDTPLEFMTSAVDHYIGDLFEFLKENDLLKNTEVFIYPDHQLMGSVSEVLEKFSDDRGLYVITTAEENKVLKGIQQPVMQMDIPRMIVNGAGIQTNATFLSSFIPKDKKKSEYIRKNKNNLLVFNEAAVNRETYAEGFRFEITDYGKLKLSALENSCDEFFLKPANNRLSVIYFTEDFRFLSHKEIQHVDTDFPPLKAGYSKKEIATAFWMPNSGYALIYSVVNDSLYTYLKGGSYLGIARNGKQAISFSENDIPALSSWKAMQEGSKLKADELFLKSTEWESISKYGWSQIYLGFKPLEIKRGVNLLYIDDTTYKVYNTDYDAEKATVERLLDTIGELAESQKLVAILVHDTSVKELGNYENELKDLDLPKLAKLEFREPYIAFFQNGVLTEKTGESSIQTTVLFKKLAIPDLAAIKKDTLRFIAHAGGAINGDSYTNSLEALNLNYKKGFRMFELDIIKTSDNVFVAAHDWEQWVQKTGFIGETPVDLKTFMENPIKNYTPAAIQDINRWFENHPDAILVTDKVNDPKEFSGKFIDKERLMMELFTLEAVKEAKELDIKVLVSQIVLRRLGDKSLETLQTLDIQYVAVSRFFLQDHLGMLKRLKAAGIKPYVFKLTNEFDENYFFQNKLDYMYGVYSNHWDFGALTTP